MLVFDSVRGEDSTGAAIIHNSGDIDVVKEVGDPFVLLTSNKFLRAMRTPNKCLIGHNRFATTGKVNRTNAHPFEAGDLIGVHNGTLKNKYAIPGHVLYDTDSEALYNHINDVGLEEAMAKVEGAWALVWFNKEDNSINFLRNDQRPMYVGVSEDNKLIMWASESWMLTVAASRNNIKVKYKELPVDRWHKYKIPAVNGTFEDPQIIPIFGKFEEKKTSASTTASTAVTEIGTKKGGTSGIIPVLASKRNVVNLRGISLESVGKIQYLEMCSDDEGDFNSYRVYGEFEELMPMLTGLWEGTVSYGVTIQGKLEYFKIEKASMKNIVQKRDHLNNAISKHSFESKHKRCTNCNEKLDYDEDWLMLDSSNVLCEQCNVDTILTIMSKQGNA